MMLGGKGTGGGPRGEAIFTTTGAHTWTCPDGVHAVCIVAIGAGGYVGTVTNADGTSGGGLGYVNALSVSPGVTYDLQVGLSQNSVVGTSWFKNAGGTVVVQGNSGSPQYSSPGSYIGDGGGNGGWGGRDSQSGGWYWGGGGGGAGGYSGSGGNGGNAGVAGTTPSSTGGGGGGGGGGTGGGLHSRGGYGGGTGLYGQGSDGAGGATSGYNGSPGGTGSDDGLGAPSQWGGGAGHNVNSSAYGAQGALRILWGSGRAFPSTDVGAG